MRSFSRAYAVALALTLASLPLSLRAQEHPHAAGEPVALQPLAQQARRVQTALAFLGQPLPSSDRQAIDDAIGTSDERAAAAALQQVLDRHVIARVHINPESRVKVEQGDAKPELVQGGTRLFLVKVINEGGIRAPLAVRSPNS